MSFDAPLWLWLLPLGVLPLVARSGRVLRNAWPAQLPRDRASDVLAVALALAGVLAIAAVIVGLAGPYRPEYAVERVGRGAEIVLVLDRSRSMDQGFGGRSGRAAPGGKLGPEALDYYTSLRAAQGRQSKGAVARELLGEFAARRSSDRFGMIVFSTLPIRVLDFTHKPDVIQAAIQAGNIGRGLSETNIGLALQAALDSFRDRPYTGSRIVMLVSDGGDRLDDESRRRVTELARRHRVATYWLYLRSANSPGLLPDQAEPPANADTVPEYFLHRFFQSLGTPYRAYEADNAEALQKAIADVDRLENLPITYFDTVPRRDLAGVAYGAALACVLLLLAAQSLEVRRWA